MGSESLALSALKLIKTNVFADIPKKRNCNFVAIYEFI